MKKWLYRKFINPTKKFGSATESENIVFGARRPGFPFHTVPPSIVEEWVSFIQSQEIKRVVCLLPEKQLVYYINLLDAYRNRFGQNGVLWSPIEDFKLASEKQLTEEILPFLREASKANEKVVVHCSGGVGRTGHVLAAWLVSFRGYSNSEAILAVKQNGRNARESGSNSLDKLLNSCREAFALK